MKHVAAWSRSLFAVALGLAMLTGCGDEPTAPEAPATLEASAEPRLASSSSLGPVLIECPADEPLTATARVTGLGGSVEVAGTRIDLPVGAVLGPTWITVRLPASNYMEVDIRANGKEHFQFRKPVSITIDYSRCTRSNIDKAALSAWYIDGETKELIQNMGGVDDKDARTITFSSDHLSGFAIAE